MKIREFRERERGPEAELLDTILGWSRDSQWFENRTAGSSPLAAVELPIGAGIPDAIVASYRSELTDALRLRQPHARILSYLRNISCARQSTISHRLGLESSELDDILSELIASKAVNRSGKSLAIAPKWRSILPVTVSIEAKVSKWQKAITQADRNRIFAHYSYVALPYRLARHASNDACVADTGLGVLGVRKCGAVVHVRRARRRTPKIWSYYYTLAFRFGRDML